MEDADFSGYATKAGLKCTDGRTITPEAFKHMDGEQVPLVWQHGHDRSENVLGHAILEARDDGMYAYGFFNKTAAGQNSKLLLEHGDIKMMSIWANQLLEKSKQVLHGKIKEVSLVLGGANPGALIDYVRIAHSDDPNDVETLDDEAIITTGLQLELAHSDDSDNAKDSQNDNENDDNVQHSEDGVDVQAIYEGLSEEQKAAVNLIVHAAVSDDQTLEHDDSSGDGDISVADVYNAMTDVQKNVVNYLIGAALETAVEHSDDSEGNLNHQEGNDMRGGNVFDQNGKDGKETKNDILSHDDFKEVLANAQKNGSFKAALEEKMGELHHSIEDIDLMFPEAKYDGNGVQTIQRRTEWVAAVMDGVKKSPFSRIKSLTADLTAEEARAKGYVKGNLKKEEIIKLLKRVTTPTTVYKKQKLDRDDIVDITDFDVVVWIKAEMRMMLDEEVAGAILVGDGREPDDDDKIDEEKMRPIAWDNEMYTHPINLPTNVGADAIVDVVLRSRRFYKGSGTPTFYTTEDILTDLLLIKDKLGRRLYADVAELSAAMRVANVIPVEVMERFPDLIGVVVNLVDYTVGADQGGQVSMFDWFDIDYNQNKWLLETRASGALTKPKSAISIRRQSGTTVNPVAPAFNPDTNTLTIPTVNGVEYYDVTDPTGTGTLFTPGDHVITRTTDVEARPTAGNSFPHNTNTDWTYSLGQH